MSKTKSQIVSMLSLALTMVFFAQHNTPFTIISFVTALVFYMIYGAKADRDERIADEARRAQKRAAQTPPPVAQASKGSHGIFVPPPLQDTRVEE
jgi:hypothetical protein